MSNPQGEPQVVLVPPETSDDMLLALQRSSREQGRNVEFQRSSDTVPRNMTNAELQKIRGGLAKRHALALLKVKRVLRGWVSKENSTLQGLFQTPGFLEAWEEARQTNQSLRQLPMVIQEFVDEDHA